MRRANVRWNLDRARAAAEKAAAQNAKLFEAEQERRRGAEALARSSRQLSSLTSDRIPAPTDP
jgi:hypothetical protein